MKTPSLRWLVVASFILVLLSWLLEKISPWMSSAMLNIGSGILTAVVLVYSYDNTIARRNEIERIERERRAVIKIGPIIRQHYRLLLDCFRSAYDFADPPSCYDINEFLGPKYQPVFSNLNIFDPSPTNSFGSVPYFQYIEESFSSLHSEIESMLLVTGRDLNQEIYLAAATVRNSEFMRVAKSLKSICAVPIPGFGLIPSQLITGMKPQIETYCVAFSQLVNALEKAAPQGLREYRIEDWHNENFPPGHAKIRSTF
ncbi:hypothetical protein AA0N74_11460 [Chromobacterium vaccinii]|uniref:hypothetical protein n=1 Tax=Chromobacterium vaccinii TaxID=1108595 RepID=UPI0031D5148C